MFTVEFFKETVIAPLLENLANYKDLFVQLLFATIVLIIGWVIAKLLQIIIRTVLRLLHFDDFSDRTGFTGFLESGGLHNIPSSTIGTLFYWLMLFISFTVAVNIFTTQSAFQLVDRLILYIPQALVAVFIFIIGIGFSIFLGKMLKSTIVRAGIKESIAQIFQTLLNINISVFALLLGLSILKVSDQVVAVIINNILKYVFLGLAIAFGLGGRYLASDIIASFKLKQLYPKGSEIHYDKVDGVLKEIGLFDSLVYTKDGIINIPNSALARKIIKRKI